LTSYCLSNILTASKDTQVSNQKNQPEETSIYITIILFLGFVLVFVAYYFLKAGMRFELDFRKPTRLPENVHPPVGERNRIHLRTDVNWEVSIETPDGPIAAEIRNISLGGAFIRCKKPLPVGEVLSLTIPDPDKEPVIATAVVVWSNANLPEEKVINRGMGVRFIKMSERHIQLVRQISPERE
jgi:uncharacterized protein (TIGR02266 family)